MTSRGKGERQRAVRKGSIMKEEIGQADRWTKMSEMYINLRDTRKALGCSVHGLNRPTN